MKNDFEKIDKCIQETFLGFSEFIENKESDEFKAGLFCGQYISAMNCKIIALEMELSRIKGESIEPNQP